MPAKPILCIDFDGVIHDYKRGWRNGEIYGDVTPGFFDWADKAEEIFRLVIYSSRSGDPQMREAMENWIGDRAQSWLIAPPVNRNKHLLALESASEKPAAFLTIDDRCVRFNGDWNAPELTPDFLRAFKPWNVK